MLSARRGVQPTVTASPQHDQHFAVTKYGQDTVCTVPPRSTRTGDQLADRRAAVKRAQVEARSKRGGTR